MVDVDCFPSVQICALLGVGRGGLCVTAASSEQRVKKSPGDRLPLHRICSPSDIAPGLSYNLIPFSHLL